MQRCNECNFFEELTEIERAKYQVDGRCTSPTFLGMSAAYVSGNTPLLRVPCRFHTKEF